MLDIEPDYEEIMTRLGLTTYEAIGREFSTQALPPRSGTFLLVHRLPNPAGGFLEVYYKHYKYQPPDWRFIGRVSKARREFANYGLFQELGLPAPHRIACGEGRDALGRLAGAFVMTQSIPDAVNLWDLLETRGSSLGPRVRRELYRQLALGNRRLHDAGFRHNDLFWRNLLVTWEGPESPRLWWIDCPRGGFFWWPLRSIKRIRDLASYHRNAARFCSRTDRLRLILYYQGTKKLDPATKRLIREVLRSGRKRWPDDWRPQCSPKERRTGS